MVRVIKPGQGSGRNIQIRVRVIERRSRPGVIKKGGGEDSRPNPNPSARSAIEP